MSNGKTNISSNISSQTKHHFNMLIPSRIINGKKTFTMLGTVLSALCPSSVPALTMTHTENNPEVMTPLAHKLGLSTDFEFYDVYSLTEPSLLSLIPRPVLALLVIIPLTPSWRANRVSEDAEKGLYEGKGPEEPVVWFKQTLGHACGSIGLTHCLLNGPAREHISPGSIISRLREEAIPLGMEDRAKLLYDSKDFEDAHQSMAEVGDTIPPAMEDDKAGHHFVAFVKENGRLWELEGDRKGPLDRGALADDEDVLSPKAIEMGLGRVIELEEKSGGNDLRFSCIALAAKVEEQ
jgi:ubiquitin carboxyl-terminal hydrolase L3